MADDVPANQSSQGMLCVKGRFGTGFIHARDRIVRPMVKREGQWHPVSWDEALDAAAEGLARHRGRFGALASAKATNEDGYVIQKLCRAVMATNNVDHCTRLCHSPSVEAMLVSMGSGATSNSYVDYEQAGCLMIVGADASANHPVIAIRFRRAMTRGARIIVINPKRVELCDQADLCIQPRPGTDVALFNAMARVILDEGLANLDFVASRTEGFEDWRASLDAVHPRARRGDHRRPRRRHRPGRALVRAAAVRRLLPDLGHGDHPAHQRHPQCALAPQPVAGAGTAGRSRLRDLAAPRPEQRAGLRRCRAASRPISPAISTTTPATLDQVRARLGRGPAARAGARRHRDGGRLPRRRGAGDVRRGREPAAVRAGSESREKAIAQLDCLVVQDLFMHETAELGHVFLPAAAFAEKDGTFTNSERRVQRVRAAVPPPGEARPDWWITAELAKRVARRVGLDVDRQFDYASASEIFDEMARLIAVHGRPLPRAPRREGGLQWPCPTPGPPGHAATSTPIRSRAAGRFVPALQTAAAAELPDPDYPFVLNTGRLLYHWHGGTMTRRVEGLLELAPRLEVALHPADARRAGRGDGRPDPRVVPARRADRLTRASPRRCARAPSSSPSSSSADSAANFLTNSAHDPSSKIPEYKVCAVRIEAIRAEPSARADSGRATTSTGERRPMMSDLEIAQRARMKPIAEIAAGLGIEEDELELYGKHKAKVMLSLMKRLAGRPNGKYIDVTAITPTPLGEGKTTTTIGLSMASTAWDRGPSRPSASRRSGRSSASRAARRGAAMRRWSRWRTATST